MHWNDGPPVTTVTWAYPSLQWPVGTEFSYTVPAGFYQRLLGARLTLDTNLTGSTRFGGYALLDPHGNQMYLARTTIGISGTNQPIFSIAPGPTFEAAGQALPDMAGAVGSANGWTLHYPDIWLWPGCQIVTSTLGLISTDHWATYNFHFEQIPVAFSSFVYP
jgi:hypothetical protein